MMRVVFILLFITIGLLVQAQNKKFRSQGDDPLEGARLLMETDPEAAIDLIRSRLNYQRGRLDDQLFVDSYILLGDIYSQIDQFDLAVARYDEALKFALQNMESRQVILAKKGNAMLEYAPEAAKATFGQCLDISIDSYEGVLCSEGVADVLVLQDSIDIALARFLEIEAYYTEEKRKEDLVRIQSKLVQLYILKDDVNMAQTNFQIAYQNNSTSKITRSKDRKAYDDAKEQVISNVGSDLGKIQIRQQNIELKKDDPKYQAVEQIKLADLYVSMNQPNLALKTLQAADKSLGEVNAPEIKSEISKKTSEVYVKQGDFENAIKALNTYEVERQMAMDQKERELDNQITIVKNQQGIDIDDKDFINSANKQSYERSLLSTQKYIIGLLSLLLLIAAISILIILRNIKAKNRANNLLELKGLRAQMNPHFLFNALNTVNEYIVLQDERKANQYLTEFSTLMRMILENSQKDLIPIQDEIDVSRKYLELEHQRFNENFDYVIDIQGELPTGLLMPPLMLQPYLENAIWHGLRYKKDKGQLNFIVQFTGQHVKVKIADDGIGRSQSKAMKTSNQKLYKSTGMQNTGKRMELINKLYNQNIDLKITNLNPALEECGTLVEINI